MCHGRDMSSLGKTAADLPTANSMAVELLRDVLIPNVFSPKCIRREVEGEEKWQRWTEKISVYRQGILQADGYIAAHRQHSFS